MLFTAFVTVRRNNTVVMFMTAKRWIMISSPPACFVFVTLLRYEMLFYGLLLVHLIWHVLVSGFVNNERGIQLDLIHLV